MVAWGWGRQEGLPGNFSRGTEHCVLWQDSKRQRCVYLSKLRTAHLGSVHFRLCSFYLKRKTTLNKFCTTIMDMLLLKFPKWSVLMTTDTEMHPKNELMDEQTARCEGKASAEMSTADSWTIPALGTPTFRAVKNPIIIRLFMGLVNCRPCSTIVLFPEKESVYKQIHVDQSCTAEGATIPQNQDSGHTGVFKFSECLKLHEKMFKRKQPTTVRRNVCFYLYPWPQLRVDASNIHLGPDSTVQLTTCVERKNSGVCSDGQKASWQRPRNISLHGTFSHVQRR